MDLSHFKTAEVTPMLVKLYDKHQLYSLAHEGSPKARHELTSVVSDLLEMELSPREQELIADVLIALLRQAETDLKEALSERLSILDNIPLRLVLEMANDEISVAEPVLRKSEILGNLDLIYLIKSKTPEYWQAIAQRKTMSDQVMNVLVDTKDPGTAVKLAENQDIALTNHATDMLATMGEKYESIAAPLLRRDDISADIAKSLYAYVGDALKSSIQAQYGFDISEATGDAVDDVLLEFSQAEEAVKTDRFSPTPKAVETAQTFKANGLLNSTLLFQTLKRGQYGLFVAMMCAFSDLDEADILKSLKQPNGQCLAIICKAQNMIKSDFMSLSLLSNKFRSNEKTVNTVNLGKALDYFDRINPAIAAKIVKNSFATH